VSSHRLKFTLRQLLKFTVGILIVYALAVPVLYFMYKNGRGLDWWTILDGDPTVPPELRPFFLKNGFPPFNIWKVTQALPFAMLAPLFLLLFYMTLMVMQFVAIFWFLARGRAYTIYPGEYDVTFDDVRGQPEIVASTKEALALFQGFKKFRDAGGYPPHGILFEGPPGTGKTLLGKAIAGSAKVPFLYASGSSFNNMFLGVGNLRIARLFRKARKLSRKYGGSVIFIDELDAVGGSRGAISATRDAGGALGRMYPIIMGGFGGSGASMYVNELLIQMDGITMAKGLSRHVRRLLHLKPKVPQYNLMVIGATNQASTLDPALLRPGRFDRKLHVGLPTGAGREDIIRYYLAKVPHEEIDITRLARATHGFSPAQIKNLVNEALIFALMDGREKLNFADLWSAKITEEIGLKDPTGLVTDRERQMTAFHESGHAVAAYVLRLDDQIQIASIVKRQSVLGHVYSTPIEDRQSELREDMRRDIVVSMAGLAAEELWYGDTTDGTASDLRAATYTAARMLGFYGMGEAYTAYTVIERTMLGGPIEAMLADPEQRHEIGKLLAECKQEATDVLRANEPGVRALAERLLEKEEVPGEEVEEIMRQKGVARAVPAYRPVMEATSASWHPPALVDSKRPRELPQDKAWPSGGGSSSGRSADQTAFERRFDW
jgi:cell division protease FtsH